MNAKPESHVNACPCWQCREINEPSFDNLHALRADRDRMDEILREAEEMLSEYHEIGRYVPDGIALLLAERDRYRKALEQIVSFDVLGASRLREVARAALDGDSSSSCPYGPADTHPGDCSVHDLTDGWCR